MQPETPFSSDSYSGAVNNKHDWTDHRRVDDLRDAAART
ncbi:MAG: hypothetical protein J07HQW2_03759 [Haloquadratum walsbyi J07HQW2]|uniref:Uncharacterized protein n=1 Tax=Haloquadratum walsbyi J07HQW2 TaxID=1238425 RepID=U1NJY3_9EURY|nr:MAG: hypothetical protein J07HQW2_03759 [Haloquadratum walsbyi J07HQW2]